MENSSHFIETAPWHRDLAEAVRLRLETHAQALQNIHGPDTYRAWMDAGEEHRAYLARLPQGEELTSAREHLAQLGDYAWNLYRDKTTGAIKRALF